MSTVSTRVARALLLVVVATAMCIGRAQAQTTLVLDAPGTQVTDVMIQAGASANTNFNDSDMIATRASVNYDYLRRALLKFDTQNTIPGNSTIQSAIMTLTVKYGGADAARAITVFPVTTAWVQEEATWNLRRTATAWTSAGGDLGPAAQVQSVPNVAGAKVSFDVTALVRSAVSGTNSSRYTRLALADLGASTNNSYREYFSSKAIEPSVRPVLRVVYGGAIPSPPPGTLNVLQYNAHHGGWGTDGVYSPDRIANWIVKSNADVVSLNEIEMKDSWSKNLDQTVVYQDLLQQKTGVTWYKVFVNAHGATTGIGNLVLSKIPFIATATYQLSDGRAAVDVTVDVNGRTVNITSVHLDSQYASYRLKEISELLPWETGLAENRLILGDFNAWPAATEITTMRATYVDTWLAAQALGTAIGNGITHGSHRIDYIFQSKSAANLTLVSQQIYATADANGIMPSDHQPVLGIFTVK